MRSAQSTPQRVDAPTVVVRTRNASRAGSVLAENFWEEAGPWAVHIIIIIIIIIMSFVVPRLQ